MKNSVNYEFLNLIEQIMVYGKEITTRNSTTKRLTNQMITFYKTPLVSVRKTAWKLALREWEWFMSGSCNTKDLHKSVQHWWKPWADEDGKIHNNYSEQFRNFAGSYYDEEREDCSFDQIECLIEGIKNHPFSRRNLITTWNTADMAHESTPITNCHGSLIQFSGNPDNTLDLLMVQRSADIVLGVPHNFIQYWAFLMWVAHLTNKKTGTFTWLGGDCHIYPDHENLAAKIINADLKDLVDPPELIYNPTSENFKASDFSLGGEYKPMFTEKLKMTV